MNIKSTYYLALFLFVISYNYHVKNELRQSTFSFNLYLTLCPLQTLSLSVNLSLPLTFMSISLSLYLPTCISFSLSPTFVSLSLSLSLSFSLSFSMFHHILFLHSHLNASFIHSIFFTLLVPRSLLFFEHIPLYFNQSMYPLQLLQHILSSISVPHCLIFVFLLVFLQLHFYTKYISIVSSLYHVFYVFLCNGLTNQLV